MIYFKKNNHKRESFDDNNNINNTERLKTYNLFIFLKCLNNNQSFQRKTSTII